MSPDPRTDPTGPPSALPPAPPDGPQLDPDTLPDDPENPSTIDPWPPSADPMRWAVPADVVYQLEEVERQLAGAYADVEARVEGHLAAVSGLLSAATGATLAVTDAVAGDVLRATDGVARGVDGILDRTINNVRRQLDAVADEFRSAGVDVPFDPGVWAMMLEESPAEWLPHIVPAIGAVLGTDSPPPPPVPPPPPGPTNCVYTSEGVRWCDGKEERQCPNGTWVGVEVYPAGCCEPGDTSEFCNPTSPPVPPPPPPPPPPVPPPTDCPVCDVCRADTCCCDRPIIVRLPPPPPPSPPYPPRPPETCPDPADVNVVVNVPPPVPPPPGPPTKGTSRVGIIEADKTKAVLNWGLPIPCYDVDKLIVDMQTENAPPRDRPLDRSSTFLDTLGEMAVGVFGEIMPTFSLLTDGLRNIASATVAAETVLTTSGAGLASSLLKELGGESVPNAGAAVHWGGKLGAARFAEQKTGFPLAYLMTAEMYAFQYANPQFIPSQAELNSMYLLGAIDDTRWQCLTAANGNIPSHARAYRDVQVGRPTFDQLVQLRLRKEITPEEFLTKTEAIGWKNATWTKDVFKLSTQLPFQSDLLRFMVRDVADEDVVRKYGYDDEFGDKFVGKLKEWAEAQGIPAEIFLFYWRAHWEIPSNTQLYEMYHRLRPDRQEVKDWDAFAAIHGPAPAEAELGPRPPVVTLQDVEYALKVNDKAPAWISSLLSIAYAPITRTDAIRAYQIGAFDARRLTEAFLDNGYSPRDAATLVSFHVTASVRTEANATGVLTIRKIVRLFKDGALSRREADDALKALLPDPDRRTALLDRTELEMRAEVRQIRLKGLRTRYMYGEDMPGGWLAAVMVWTGDASSAQNLLDRWFAEFMARGREATVRQLCAWYSQHLLSADDYLKRLGYFGYSPQDAHNIAAVCDKQQADRVKASALKQAKELEKRAKEAKKEKDKAAERACHPPKPCWDGSDPPK